MDVEWALEELRKFVAMTVTRSTRGLSNAPIREFMTPTPEADIIAQAPVAEAIVDRVIPDWRTAIRKAPSLRWSQLREASQRGITILERQAELREKLGDDAPTLDASRLHPWAWEGARSMWQSRHYSQAVVDALKKVQAETQNKTGRHNVTEADLFNQVFSSNPPKPGEPRLRLRPDDGSETFKNVHRGARSLAEGMFAGVRNLISHTYQETDVDEQRALEQLAAVSVLARWVYEATVDTV